MRFATKPTESMVNGMSDGASVKDSLPMTSIDSPSYPTRSLQFLQTLSPTQKDHQAHQRPEQSKVRLDIIVVGGGLGGLATAIALARRGHAVTVFEQASQLGEVGAGIQIPSNSSRLLLQWGLGPFLSKHVVEPEGMRFRRWEDGKVIGYTKLVPDFRQHFNAPYYVVHRAHFHDALHKLALELGVCIHVGCKVAEYDADKPSLKLVDGATYTADLIVAADGVKSIARSVVLKAADEPPRQTGFAAYRATVKVEQMKADPDVSWLLEKPGLNIWIGEARHVMTYTIAGGNSFNMVLSHVDHSDPSKWKQENAIKDMREHFIGWDPRLTKIIDMIDKTLKWPLLSGAPLRRWLAPSKKILILGDAAHAMVPYMSQGAAMAVEDGAALAEAIHQIDSDGQVPQALQVFEKERLHRTSQMQEASLVNGKLWHFADGPEQEARDEAMLPEVEGRHFLVSPNQWSDPVTQWWCYGYDAEEAIVQAWRNTKPVQVKEHVNGSVKKTPVNGWDEKTQMDGLDKTAHVNGFHEVVA